MFDVVDKVDARLPYRIKDIKPSGVSNDSLYQYANQRGYGGRKFVYK